MRCTLCRSRNITTYALNICENIRYGIPVLGSLWIMIRIRIGMDPHWFCSDGSGSMRAIIIQRIRAMWRNFLFWSPGRSLLRAEDFACSLDVLLRAQGITKLQFLVLTALDPDPIPHWSKILDQNPHGKHADSHPFNTDIRLIDIFSSPKTYGISATFLVSISYFIWFPTILTSLIY